MIYLTGDTHGDFRHFSNRRMKTNVPDLADNDYIIICGDVGLCWARDKSFKYYCELFQEKKYTVLWVQGNHENYDMIAEFPLEDWNGGKVRHIVRDKVILLERGQVFNIEGHTFFTFGGASSRDITGGILHRDDPNFTNKKKRASKEGLPYRIYGESWWPQELPSEEEMQEGLRNLEKVGYKVDYVITHCCGTDVQDSLDPLPGKLYPTDILTDYLQELENKLEYKQWYFGHYHTDKKVDDKHTLLYKAILKLDDTETDLSKLPRLGHPKYTYNDEVIWKWGEEEFVGKICVVDAYGTMDRNEEPSYDILREENNTLYKHIPESEIISLK